MFEEMVVSSPNPTKTNKPFTVLISMVIQILCVAILILIPLIYTCLLYTSPSPRD